jgi:hypothetical protein
MEDAAAWLPPYLGKGVTPMGFDSIVSLLGLLIATAGLVLDVAAFAIAARKGKRPRHMRPPKH